MSNSREISENASNLDETGIDSSKIDKQVVKGEVQSLMSQRMTIAGVFFDIARFVSDVEHLKFVIDAGSDTLNNYALLLTLLIVSLSLQLLVGFLLFIRGFKQTSDESNPKAIDWSKVVDNIIVGIVSLIALINILITVFGDRTESFANFKANLHNNSGSTK